MQAAGVVSADTPKGDVILFGAAASEEADADLPTPRKESPKPRGCSTSAWPTSSPIAVAPEAAWRSADIRWQLQKADIFSLPSAHEKDAYMRESIDDEELRKLRKIYPRSDGRTWPTGTCWTTRSAAIGRVPPNARKKKPKCTRSTPQEHPDSPRAAESLYNAVYRQGALHDIYTANGDDKKSEEAKTRAVTIADTIASKYPQSDYAARAASLVYQLQESIPIYGTDRQ